MQFRTCLRVVGTAVACGLARLDGGDDCVADAVWDVVVGFLGGVVDFIDASTAGLVWGEVGVAGSAVEVGRRDDALEDQPFDQCGVGAEIALLRGSLGGLGDSQLGGGRHADLLHHDVAVLVLGPALACAATGGVAVILGQQFSEPVPFAT